MTSPFRQKSLERLSSPEQLDQMLEVTSPAIWLAFLSLTSLILVTIIWSIFGSIPQKTNGIGVLLPAGDYREFAVQTIAAPVEGLLTKIDIAEGDNVLAGQVIGQIDPIDDEEQQNQIRSLQQQTQELQEEHESLLQLERQSLQQLDQRHNREKSSLQSIINAKRVNIQHLRTLAASIESLANQGAITTEESVRAASGVVAAETELNELQHEYLQLDLNYESLELTNSKLRTQRELQLAQFHTRLQALQRNLEARSQIVSDLAGTVIQVSAPIGTELREGERIALLEQSSQSRLELQGYVPVFTGEEVLSGMPVQISPANIKREEYGFLNGSVTWVSEYPEDEQTILNLVENQRVVDRIINETQIPLQIEVSLDTGNNHNSYSWSSGNVPPQALSIGVLAEFSVITESKRPIELVVPYIRRFFGLN